MFRGWSSLRLLSGELEQLTELADHLGIAAFLEAGGYARGEVAFEQRAFEGFDGALDGVGLLEDIDAVDVLLDHLANTAQVALDRRQAVQDLFLVGLHRCCSYPWGRGSRAHYRSCPGAASTPSPRG